MIRPGEEWGTPTTAAPDLEIRGTDSDLARALELDRLVRFVPTADSDLARAVGLDAPALRGVALPVDALRVHSGDGDSFAVNMVIVGTAPDRLSWRSPRFSTRVTVDGRHVHDGPATTVVVATGQFLRGSDVAPRGHPGDGRAEIQVYCVARRERRAVRARLRTGTHVPHPAITARAGRRVEITLEWPQPLECDGRAGAATSALTVEVVPNAYRLLV